jgi:hypothetical protein
MRDHFFTKRDSAVTITVKPDSIKREGGIMQLVEVAVIAQQLDLCLRAQSLPIVSDRTLRANPETFEVMVRLKEIAPASDLTKQLERRAIENSTRRAANSLEVCQSVVAPAPSAILFRLLIAIKQFSPWPSAKMRHFPTAKNNTANSM